MKKHINGVIKQRITNCFWFESEALYRCTEYLSSNGTANIKSCLPILLR